MKIQYFLPIFASIALLSFDTSYGMNSDGSDTTSSDSTPRRKGRVIIPGSKPTMKIGSQIFHFPKGIDPDRDIVGAERSYVPPRSAQVAPQHPATVVAQ